MAATKSNRSSAAGQNKKKASAVQNAAKKIAGRERSSANPKPPRSVKQISQGRFPGETPLTGEDRPSGSAGNKQQGYEQRHARVRDAGAGRGSRKTPAQIPSPRRAGRNQRMAGDQR
jgi:hypothetical protein